MSMTRRFAAGRSGTGRLSMMAAVAGLAAIGVAGLPHQAKAWWHGGVAVGVVVPPVVVAPPPYYAPPPVYVAPPVAYAPPPYYAPRRVWIPAHWNGPYWVQGHWS